MYTRVYDTPHPERWLLPAACYARKSASFNQLAEGAPGYTGTTVPRVDITGLLL